MLIRIEPDNVITGAREGSKRSGVVVVDRIPEVVVEVVVVVVHGPWS
jgi:hypothetical protein